MLLFLVFEMVPRSNDKSIMSSKSLHSSWSRLWACSPEKVLFFYFYKLHVKLITYKMDKNPWSSPLCHLLNSYYWNVSQTFPWYSSRLKKDLQVVWQHSWNCFFPVCHKCNLSDIVRKYLCETWKRKVRKRISYFSKCNW